MSNNLKFVVTHDSSSTIFSEKYGEHYHSINGAKNESEHIFINLGLKNFENKQINILEIGYGTALNAILTYLENKNLNNNIFYHGIELNVLPKNIYFDLNFNELFHLSENEISCFYDKWNEKLFITENFSLLKENIDFNPFIPINNYDLIYFDAFSPETQPEMWNYENLNKIIDKLNVGGLLVTYCIKGIIKESLRNLGLFVKRCKGPVGKRHVISAKKMN